MEEEFPILDDTDVAVSRLYEACEGRCGSVIAAGLAAAVFAHAMGTSEKALAGLPEEALDRVLDDIYARMSRALRRVVREEVGKVCGGAEWPKS